MYFSTKGISTHCACTPALEVLVADALCGAGKTEAARRVIAKGLIMGLRIIVAGPTAYQSDQFYRAVLRAVNELAPGDTRMALRVSIINSEVTRTAEGSADTDPRVARVLREAIHATPPGAGRVICITHATLLTIPLADIPAGWLLVRPLIFLPPS